jgi:hypothetical protein
MMAALIAAATAGLAMPAAAETVHARLSGFEEVPAVSSPGEGRFRARIDQDGGIIFYELEFGDLQGAVTQAHIHVAQAGVNGGISAWLCGTAALPGPAGTPLCPDSGGVVNGTIMSANVVGPAGQLIAAGEFDELVKAIRAGVAYANVHSSAVPAGEIRGQIDHRGRHGKH